VNQFKIKFDMSTQTIPEPHPGEILLEEFIKPAGVTPYRVAKDSGISQPTMNQIVKGMYFTLCPRFMITDCDLER